MITDIQKQKIISAVKAARENYPSDAKHATALGISKAVYSAIKNGKADKTLSEGNWISIARKLNVTLREGIQWNAARTATFEFVSAQLEACQQSSLSAILVDIPNIGKTFTARYYVRTHKNAVYIDCSQVKTKTQLVRRIAAEFGVSSGGWYHNVYEDLCYYLRSIERPLVILDEAGDLKNEAMLELKALWNATERSCAWYMMGADGLRERIRRSIDIKMVGYAEIFSRYGARYSHVTPDDARERAAFLNRQAGIVAKLNAPEGADVSAIVRRSGGGLRRVYTEIEKLRQTAAEQQQ